MEGPAGAWCWLDIDSEDVNKIKIIRKLELIYYSFMWLMIIINSYFIVNVIFGLRKLETEENKDIIQRSVSRLKWYPIVLVICLIPASINRLLNYYNYDYLALVYLHTMFDSLQGFLFSLVYGFNPEIRKAVKDLCSKIFCRGTNLEESFNESLETNNKLIDESILKSSDSSYLPRKNRKIFVPEQKLVLFNL